MFVIRLHMLFPYRNISSNHNSLQEAEESLANLIFNYLEEIKSHYSRDIDVSLIQDSFDRKDYRSVILLSNYLFDGDTATVYNSVSGNYIKY